MDVFDATTRSRIMSRIRRRGTGPEVGLRRALRAAGAPPFRANARAAGTRPDILFPGARRAGSSVIRVRKHAIAADPARCARRILRRLRNLSARGSIRAFS